MKGNTVNPIPFERYLATAMDHPRKNGEGAMAYVVRLAELAAGYKVSSVKSMPTVYDIRMPYRDDGVA